jgi:hypothetical protein
MTARTGSGSPGMPVGIRPVGLDAYAEEVAYLLTDS